MSDLMKRLGPRAQRGSKPRCHFLTHGAPDIVAAQLTALAAPFASIGPDDRWMPLGFEDTEEAQLHQAPRLLPPGVSAQLGRWWLPTDRQEARTPNFDIASTCTIEGRPGLLLVEAKAHEKELTEADAGRPLSAGDSEDRQASHKTIGAAIESANAGLASATGVAWHLSRDSHYQMSNRFAWSWKLTQLGIPVVLVYLGFLNATEMADQGPLLADGTVWEKLVKEHSASLFPEQVWNRKWSVDGVPFIPLIRTLDQPLHPETGP